MNQYPATCPPWKAALKLFSIHSRIQSSPARGRIFSVIAIIVVLFLLADTGMDQEERPAQVIAQRQTLYDRQEHFAWNIERHTQAQSYPLETELRPTTRIVKTIYLPTFSYPGLDQIEEFENLPPAEALKGLQPMLSDSDPVIRMAALESLATMDYPGIPAALTEALRDPMPQIRIEALEALALQNDAAAITDIETCLYDSNRQVRIAAIDTLAELESEAAVMALASLLSDGDAIIRHHTVNALGEIGGDNAISYLSGARYDPNETIRANAEAILLELGHQAGIN